MCNVFLITLSFPTLKNPQEAGLKETEKSKDYGSIYSSISASAFSRYRITMFLLDLLFSIWMLNQNKRAKNYN
jgi:hypothetical protein